MPDSLQPDLKHLPPDQLSAFAENILPEHERLAALAHLAECSDCRRVVFLAQQADPAIAAAPTAEAPRRSWFSLPQIFVAATAALACSLILAFIVHNRYEKTPPTPTVTTAKLDQPLQVAPPAPTPQKAAAAPQPAARASTQPAPINPPKPAPVQLAPLPHVGVIGGINAGVGPATGKPSEARVQDQASTRFFSAASASAIAADNITSDSMSEKSANVQIARAATVTLNGASIDSVANRGRVTEAFAGPLLLKLPSNKPIASRLVAGTRILALDTAGTLFITSDNGAHWTAVAPQWPGKAVQIGFAPSPARLYIQQPQQSQTQTPSAPSTGYTASGVDSSGQIHGMGEAAAPQQQVQQTTIPTAGFQLTTAAGAVWLSTDGLAWHPR